MGTCSPKRLCCDVCCFTFVICDPVSQSNLINQVSKEGLPLSQGIGTVRTFECEKRHY